MHLQSPLVLLGLSPFALRASAGRELHSAVPYFSRMPRLPHAGRYWQYLFRQPPWQVSARATHLLVSMALLPSYWLSRRLRMGCVNFFTSHDENAAKAGGCHAIWSPGFYMREARAANVGMPTHCPNPWGHNDGRPAM
ncbi:hypothetical protein HGRIS_013388 [Hohenbuehelia grisea]|uniref:Secreted protein n=1 Tax=Hohenbuehelia grisea TaxID=104357 RepID=A0ABR3IVA5_9AGAR